MIYIKNKNIYIKNIFIVFVYVLIIFPPNGLNREYVKCLCLP